MLPVNRSCAIIRPKRPFIKWANSCNQNDRELTPDYFIANASIFLIPEYIMEAEARKYVNTVWQRIFENELKRWSVNEAEWPAGRTQKMFWQWFAIEFRHRVIDAL